MIRWGIIGCGDVCEVKSGPGFQRARDSALVAVMRRDGARAADFARRHGVPRWHDDADALLHDPEVDAVYVATPPDAHCEYTLRAARAGKPVYVEKPMARTAAEAETMFAACREAGVPLYVAYYRRAMPRFRQAKALLDAGHVGRVRVVTVELWVPPAPEEFSAEAPWRVRPEVGGGGRFVDMGCHQLDLVDFLLGPIAEVQGLAGNQGGRYGAEDVVAASFRTAQGVFGTGTWSYSAAVPRDRIEVVGERGTLAFACFDLAEPLALATADGLQHVHVAPEPHVQQPLIQTVVDALHGRGECPSTGESALRTTRVIDRILADWRAAASPGAR